MTAHLIQRADEVMAKRNAAILDRPEDDDVVGIERYAPEAIDAVRAQSLGTSLDADELLYYARLSADQALEAIAVGAGSPTEILVGFVVHCTLVGYHAHRLELEDGAE